MTKPKQIGVRSMLVPGGRLEAGRAREVAELILTHPRKTGQVVECLWDDDPGVANRAADALERASHSRPSLLAPWKDALLARLAEGKENKLRWNLALMMARLELTVSETERTMIALESYLDDRGSIVRTAAMHGMAGLALQNPVLLPEVLDTLRILTRSGTPAMRARGRMLLKKLEAADKLPRGRKTLLIN
jgi:hypothetical protein